ncbi:MAG: hypothetical protein WC327_02290 [Candidatus Cloacimonadia bacterium]
MKKSLILLVLMLLPLLVFAETGIGIIVGQPSGISFKQWLGGSNAVDAAVAWSFLEGGGLYGHVNYLYENKSNVADLNIPWFWGIGANVGSWKSGDDLEIGLGVRVPIGLNFRFQKIPSELFFEVAPGLDVVPSVGFGIGGALGYRFIF